MPACFQLFRKGEKEASPLAQIDDEMRVHFGADPDPEHYYLDWVDIIGFYLAIGKTWDEIAEILTPTSRRHPVLAYLRERFEPMAWHER